MTVKGRTHRLRRLLGGKSRFRRNNKENATATVSTASLSADSDDAIEDLDDLVDVYADVRSELEERANSSNCQQDHAMAIPPIPIFVAYTTYLAYATFILVGHIRDICAYLLGRGRFLQKPQQQHQQHQSNNKFSKRNNKKHTRIINTDQSNQALFAPLLKSWEHFYTRRLYTRVQDAFNRPIASNPGATIQVLERVSDDSQKSMKVLGNINNLGNDDHNKQLYLEGPHYCTSHDGSACRQCVNLGSYNYLGFADDWHVTCAKDVKGSLQQFGISTSSCRNEYGTTRLHTDLEATVARFVGKEAALCLNMGFNTNATTIPALCGRGDLIISDALNHTSIVNGARSSGAAIRIFRHNDMQHLQDILKEAIVLGRPRTRRPWNKILVIVEGIYSMEGEYCDLRNVVRLAKQYGAYVYLDEAHSIGAMGATGRGCTEYCNVDPGDVDIMMGTFTKSFGAMGGYICASRSTISHLRRSCAASAHHNALSPVVCQQVLTAFKVIMGEDGTNIGKKKLQALRDNANYFRMRLEDMGLQVLGEYDSPIMPVMLYNPCKIAAFSRECLKRGLAVVVVGFPAVPILVSRARFCISAGHSREDLDHALEQIDEIADILKLRYARSFCG